MEDYREMREMVAKFSDAEVAPLAAEIDHNGKLPEALVAKLAENGFLGSFIPEEYGGAGMDYTSYAILVEELSRGCASTGVLVSAHSSLATWPIIAFGNEEQKKKYLPQLASGQRIGCFCLSEPNAGSDAASLTTMAEDKGDHYLLNGTKNWITNGKEATLAIVFAKTEKTDNHKGISAFIVECETPGFEVQKEEDKLGIKGSSTTQIVLENVKVPKENLLGKEKKGFSIGLATLDGGRIGIAAQAVGIAEAAFRYAKRYSLERVQFGKPIGDLQAIQFILADMSTSIAASRLLCMEASRLKDAGAVYSKEAAQAKVFASETAMNVTTKGIQVLGGNGYTKEYPMERHFRDAKITEIYEGTSEIQRLVIASMELKELR
jgi:butyryl-CoA dehydrogenase